MSSTDFGAALLNSLSLGSILILAALGLAITFGVMRVINMAHGDMLMLGAYTAFVITDKVPKILKEWADSPAQAKNSEFYRRVAEHLAEYGLYYSIPAAFLVAALAGYILEKVLIRFLYGRPLDSLLATWGVSIILQQAVNLGFGPNLEAMHIPERLQGGWAIGAVTVPYYRMFIIGITVLCLTFVYLWFYQTSFGLKIRAVVQNRPMASALGVSTRRVDSLTFAFATGLAGVAGCILAHQFNTKYDMGSTYIVDAFMVVILGGMGQLAGSVAGGALMGTTSSFAEKLIGNASLAKVVVLSAVILCMFVRPSGLFASKERTYD